MNKNKIPKGIYCYDHKGKCPYWSIDKSLPKMENGYCSYLKQSDWDINEQANKDSLKALDDKTNIAFEADAHVLCWSLLWDAVKECGENDED